MCLAAAGGVMEQDDGRVGPAVTTVVGHHRPEVSALGGLSARIEHWRAGLIDGQRMLAGSITRSIRGRCGGRCPRLRPGLRGVSAPLPRSAASAFS